MVYELHGVSRNGNLYISKCSRNQIWSCSAAILEVSLECLNDGVRFKLPTIRKDGVFLQTSMMGSIFNRLGSGILENSQENSIDF